MPIHQSGRHKGKLIQAELQIEGIFRAGDPHPEFKDVVFVYLKNGTQRWATKSDRKRRKESLRQSSSRSYYAKVTDDKLTPYGQVRREMKREGIKRVPRDEFKSRINEVKVSRGADLTPERVQNQQYEPPNTKSTAYLLEQAEQTQKYNDFAEARKEALKKAEADLAEEIGSENFWDLTKAGLQERFDAAEAEFIASYNRLHNHER